MEILELHLKHYGKFEDHRISLKPGVNIIYGRNETGKSTIHSFIRAMFFGLPKVRGRAARQEEYRLRQPWENPAYFAGSLRLKEGGDVYRIDRNFDREHQSVTVACETQGKKEADPEAKIAELLGGMNEASFCNTVFIPQAGAGTGEVLMEELRGFMVNYDSARGTQTDVAKVLQLLQKKKKQFAQKKKSEEALLEEQIGRRQTEADYIRREIDALRARRQELEGGPAGADGGRREESFSGADSGRQESAFREADSGRQENASLRSGSGEYEEEPRSSQGRYSLVLQVLLAAASLLAFLCAWLLKALPVRIFLGVFGVIFLALIIPVRRFLEAMDGGPDEEEAAEEREWRLGNIVQEIQEREDKYQKLQGELEVLYQNQVRLEGTEIEIEALDLAIERIAGLSSAALQESGGGLSGRASEILREITGGKYVKLLLDDAAQVCIQSRERVLHLHEVSYGTAQQAYFALRLAAGELLAGGRELPLVLDEPFAMYDSARMAAVMRQLFSSRRQVILFTCQEREQRILKRIREESEEEA